MDEKIVAFSYSFEDQFLNDSKKFRVKIQDNDPFIEHMKNFAQTVIEGIDYEKDFLMSGITCGLKRHYLPLEFAIADNGQVRSKIYFDRLFQRQKQSVKPDWVEIHKVTKGEYVNIRLVFSPILCKDGEKVWIANEVVGIVIYEKDNSINDELGFVNSDDEE